MHPKGQGIRNLGRELAFISLYIYDVSSISLKELLDFSWYDEIVEHKEEDILFIPLKLRNEVYKFSYSLLNGAVSNIARLDSIIKQHLVNWSFSRVRSVDKAILRLSVYTILYCYNIPVEVSISAANYLSNKYSDDNASYYINGILHRVKEEYRKNFVIE